MNTLSEFELEQQEKDANRLVICTGCYGSGENRWEQGRACATCDGMGKAAAEPHVLRLIALVRELHKQQRVSYLEGAEAMRKAIKEALASSYDAGIRGVIATLPVPEREQA